MTETVFSGSTTDTDGPPDYDADEVRVLASRAELRSLELVELTFSDVDAGEYFDAHTFDEESTMSVGLFVSWSFDAERSLFSCLVTTDFSARSPLAEDEPDDDRTHEGWVQCVFRVRYAVADGESPVTTTQAQQFAHWNVPFNVWPFFREITANMFQRTRHTPMLVPLFRMPR